MAWKPSQLLGLVLSILRQMAGRTQGWLEQSANLSQGAVSRLERGHNLDRRLLDQLAAILGHPPYLVQGLVTSLEPYFASEESIGSPADFNFRQRQIHRQFVCNAAGAIGEASERGLHKRLWREKREAAIVAWQSLRRVPEGNQPALVETVSDFHTWAVVERLCEESAKAASHDVKEAAALAALARISAARTPGAVGYQTWLAGYAGAFEGNAHHVAGNLLLAREVFTDADTKLRAGIPIVPMDRSRPLYLYGVHLNYCGDLEAALLKTDEALAFARNAGELARILIVRAAVFNRKCQLQEALHLLARARLLSKGVSERRLGLVIAFNEAAYLVEAGNTEEAASRLSSIQSDIQRLGRSLDEVRFRWLTARVASSQGRWAEAASLLHKVWKALDDREILFDSALAALDLAGVELERGNAKEVKALASASAQVFKALVLPAELLAAIQLFWKAVRQEAASAEEARNLAWRMRRSGGGDAEAA